MSNIKLETRYIVPFSYETVRFDKLHKLSDSWEIGEDSSIESDIYEYVRNSFITTGNEDSDDHSIKIGCLYKYTGELLPQNFRIKYINGNFEQPFYIRAVHLALFQTGIGLLWFSPDTGKSFSDDEKAVDFNYHMKEMARNERSNYLFRESVEIVDGSEGNIPPEKLVDGGKRYKKTAPFYLGVWIDDIISTISPSITYYPHRTRTLDGKKRRLSDKVVLFHCGLLSKCDNSEETLVYLTRGYKGSYQLSDNQLEQIYKPFENVRCFATSEGCGYYALIDDDTPSFFSDLTKVNTDYFLLYMLALYQSYTLLHYSELIAEKLSATQGDYKNYSKKLESSLDDLTTELNVFLAKSVYASVSHIQHQNEFFKRVSQSLLISENIASVSAGIEALNNIERTLYEDEVEKKNRYLNSCLTIVSFLALFSAFNDVNEFLNNHFYTMFPLARPWATFIANGALLIVFLAVLILLLRHMVYRPSKDKTVKH